MKALLFNSYNSDAVDVAKSLLGCTLVIKNKSEKYKWRIIETEAYKESENNTGLDICHKDIRAKSVGHIFSEGGNGLIISCGTPDTFDNILIRGTITLFDSQPYKAMKAISDFNFDFSSPLDLLSETSNVYIESCSFNIESFTSDFRVGLNGKSNNKWNFKLIDFKKCDVIPIEYLKSLNS